MSAVLVGNPAAGALEACRLLGVAGTLVWHDAGAIREATDELVDAGWDALLVNPADEGFSTASMSHWAQLHGAAPAVVLWIDADEAIASTVDVSLMVMRHLPPLPVLVTGLRATELASAWEKPRLALELERPTVVSAEDLAEAWSDAERLFTTLLTEHSVHDRTARAEHRH